jgi:hypothetical protein
MDRFPVEFATGERLRIREASREQYPEIRRLLRAAYAGYASTVAAAVFPVYLADVLDLTDEAATARLPAGPDPTAVALRRAGHELCGPSGGGRMVRTRAPNH